MCKLGSVSMSDWRIVHDSSGKVGRSSQVSQYHFSLSVNWDVFTSAPRAPDTLCVILEQYPQHSRRHCRLRVDHRHLKCKERTVPQTKSLGSLSLAN